MSKKKIKAHENRRHEVNYHKQPTSQLSYTGNFTRKQIEEYAQSFSNKLKDLYGPSAEMNVAMLYPDGWRAGYFRDAGKPVVLYSYADSNITTPDPDRYKEFQIYLIRKK